VIYHPNQVILHKDLAILRKVLLILLKDLVILPKDLVILLRDLVILNRLEDILPLDNFLEKVMIHPVDWEVLLLEWAELLVWQEWLLGFLVGKINLMVDMEVGVVEWEGWLRLHLGLLAWVEGQVVDTMVVDIMVVDIMVEQEV